MNKLKPKFAIVWLPLLLFLLITQLVYVIESVVIRVENLPEKCDFSRCAKPSAGKLNVHLVPHTHDDVGWLKTEEQYYWGTHADIANAGVQYILDAVVEELIRDKRRRFIYVETAFFWKWWTHQNAQQREIVHELVRSGQLEFINGGWSMNDEATAHYNSIIDQMTWGLRRLNDTFGRCGVPRVAWQIDPFGHSREQAALFAAMNFDAVFFAREDYQDHGKRQSARTLEHVWQGSDDLGKAADLFTGMMHMGYGPPRNLNWELLSMTGADEPVVDDKASDEYNVPTIVSKFVDQAKKYASVYATNHVMFPMGTDFHYMDAHIYYKNMDKLIEAVNRDSDEVSVFYSTPSCYAKALHNANRTWTSKTDDYFPYASDPHAYWTGYFSSRPAIKRYERVGNNLLQICKQIDSIAGNDARRFEPMITRLREMMGVMQHHDAVTGTEKQHVAFNYAKHLSSAINDCLHVIEQTYTERLLPLNRSTQAFERPNVSPKLKQQHCPLLNISACPATESGRNLAVNIYNPLAHEIAERVIRLPVSDGKFYSVSGPSGEAISSTLIPIPEFVRKIPGRVSNATHELVFRVTLPPLGLRTYFVRISATHRKDSANNAKRIRVREATTLSAKTFKVVFDQTGALDHVRLRDGRTISLRSDFRYYLSHTGDNSKFDLRASGAYIFRPASNETYKAGKMVRADLFTTTHANMDSHTDIQEIHQQYDSFISQIIRVDPTKDEIEFDWIVGPIPVDEEKYIGKEVVARFVTDLANRQTFYTDANGRQMLRREWNRRPTWKLQVEEPISGNYYPVNSRIFLRDQAKDLQLTILNDRSQGGTSPADGALELMLHRRMLQDDAFGVGEALNEMYAGKGLVVRGRHILLLDSISKSAAQHRPIAQQMFMEPIITFAVGLDEQQYRSLYHTQFSALTRPLPPNVHLLTLEQWREPNHLLLRLEHIYQANEDAALSKPVRLQLARIFRNFEILEAQELTLSANADIAAVKQRLVFPYVPVGEQSQPLDPVPFDEKKLEVTLNPMQIRTFNIRVRWN